MVIDAGDGLVSTANDNKYLGTTQIASGTLVVSDNSQRRYHYNRQVLIFTDKPQESVMELPLTMSILALRRLSMGVILKCAPTVEVAVDAGVRLRSGARDG